MSEEVVISENQILKISGRGVPKTEDDQNTDDIMPARFLKEITFANMGKYAYYDERFKDGEEVETHPLNDSKYEGATILIGGNNYGCGSSREHAPQALHRYGIKAVIAPSFAEIFAGNCASLGVVGVTASKEEVVELAEFIKENPSEDIKIDLQEKTISYSDKTVSFDMLEGRRQAFLNGTWDAMTILEQSKTETESVAQGLEYLHS